MSEATTEVLTCERCYGQFDRPRPTGGKPRFCKPCAQESLREWKREWRKAEKVRLATEPKPDATTPPVCIDCKAEVPHPLRPGHPSKRCPPCKGEAKRAQARKAAATYRAANPVERPTAYTCIDCCGVFERLQLIGRLPLRCPDCRHALKAFYTAISNAKRVWVPRPRKVSQPRRTPCWMCGVDIDCVGHGRLTRYCPSCYEIRKAQLRTQWTEANPEKARISSRSAAKRRRARLKGCVVEHFLDSEIYERDRWRCQLCRTAVNTKTRWPHPMSASLDHVVPLALNGDHVRANVQLAHLVCNQRKSTGTQGEQLLLIG